MLWLLWTAFALRVLAQLVQVTYPVDFLPPASSWQGSGLRYGWLLAVQGAILGVMLRSIVHHQLGGGSPKRRLGTWLFAFGSIYFLIMAVRLAIGLSGLTAMTWFHKPIPAVFHLVLASFVLILAAYHRGWLRHA